MFLGIDIGTSAVKAVVTGEDGTVAAEASAELQVSRPAPLHSEQDPDDWWAATDTAVQSLDPRYRKAVRAVGLAGQMHGATLLDGSDRPLRPAILWNDGRSEQECIELESAEPRSRQITANMAFPGFTAPKLRWVAKHEPEIFSATETVLSGALITENQVIQGSIRSSIAGVIIPCASFVPAPLFLNV